MKLNYQLILLPFICAVLMAAHSCERGKSLPRAVNEKADEAMLVCQVDDDCVAVKDNCCGCRQGGKQIAIAKKSEEAWEDQLSKRCGDIFCAQVISNDASCSQKAHCDQGRCVLK